MSMSAKSTLVAAQCAPKARSPWLGFGKLFALARQRRTLGQLEPHLLKDIGITPAQAFAETSKNAWDVPKHWHH